MYQLFRRSIEIYGSIIYKRQFALDLFTKIFKKYLIERNNLKKQQQCQPRYREKS